MIRNRNTPVAVIIPFGGWQGSVRRFGFARDDDKVVDWAVVDTMDSDIAGMFGT